MAPGSTTHAIVPSRPLDNVDGAETMAQFLGILGNETKTEHDGLAAVSALVSFMPSVVLLDIGLPHLNGHEAAKRIRESPGGKDILLIALSGWEQTADRQRSRDAGSDWHFVKPVALEVMGMVRGSGRSRQRARWQEASARAHQRAPLRLQQ